MRRVSKRESRILLPLNRFKSWKFTFQVLVVFPNMFHGSQIIQVKSFQSIQCELVFKKFITFIQGLYWIPVEVFNDILLRYF